MGALISLTVSEAFGLRAFGSIMGLVGTVGIFPQLVGPLVVGVPLDATDSYTLAFTIIVALYLARAVALLLAGSMPRIYTNEEF